MNKLEGKKVLLLSWDFYHYPTEIKKELEKRGAKVTYIKSSNINNTAIRKLSRKTGYDKRYINKIRKILDDSYDILFLINLKIFPEDFIRELAEKYKTSYKILYMWDTLSNSKINKDLLGLFDKAYSFDDIDVANNAELNFLPLFYCDKSEEIEAKYDFCFIGVAHSKRIAMTDAIKDFCKAYNYTYYIRLYLTSHISYLYKKLFTKELSGKKMSDFVFTTLSREEVKHIMSASKIIVDMELVNQNGLTMRSVESLGMKKKLITTNPNVKKYDFYNSNNVLVVNRDDVVIPKSFVNSEYIELNPAIYEKYSLSGWIDAILS